MIIVRANQSLRQSSTTNRRLQLLFRLVASALRDGVYPTASHRLTWTCAHHSKFHLNSGCSPVFLLSFPWAGLANQAREAHPGFPQLGGNYSRHRLWWNAFFSFSSLCGLCPQIIFSADLSCYVVVMPVIFLAWVRPEALGT